jgi:hypothetical protein
MLRHHMVCVLYILLQGTRDIYSADGSAIEPSAPLAVLVNRGTASASEVRSTNTASPILCERYHTIQRYRPRSAVASALWQTWLEDSVTMAKTLPFRSAFTMLLY